MEPTLTHLTCCILMCLGLSLAPPSHRLAQEAPASGASADSASADPLAAPADPIESTTLIPATGFS